MRIIGRLKDYYTRVLDLPDAPVKVAWGAALGTTVDFFPIPIVSIPVAYLLARLVGVNGVAAALAATFFKWAVPFFYLFNFGVGQLITGDWSVTVAALDDLDTSNWTQAVSVLGYSFFIGAAVNGLLAGGLVYFILKRLLLFRQKRREVITGCLTDDQTPSPEKDSVK